ncbi:hypothetical protein CLV63_11579 [Murinocardiopsis flavida]|uniref:Uncharacterized protein n=1 Tax=Murinocardiopsis flavida TaxID=645275 RepID=A0A2P8DE07_9ACTN|nr:hypothetical protein [Murinocardiopsis flavida]PSK95419.1 hypothetical protein CLV63_11579 [Murinocardiopsis flavida]
MIRTDRSARARRAAAVVRALGGPLRRALLLGGLAAAAWLLGTAVASADTLGVPDDPAQSAVRGAAEQGDAPAAKARGAADPAAPAEAPAAVPDAAKAAPEPDVPEPDMPAVDPAPEPPGPSASDVVADAADDAGGQVREAIDRSADPLPGGDPAGHGRNPAPEPEQHRPEPADDAADAEPAPRSDAGTPDVRTGPTDRYDAAAQHGPDVSAHDPGARSDSDGAPSSGSAALPAQAQGGGPLTLVADLTRFTGPRRSGGAAQARHIESAVVPQVPVADRSFSPD